MPLTGTQNAQFETLKRALEGDADALAAVFATASDLTTDDITDESDVGETTLTDALNELYGYQATHIDETEKTTTSSTWVQLASHNFTTSVTGEFFVDVRAVYGGTSEERDYELRFKVNGVVIDTFCIENPEDVGTQKISVSSFTQVTHGGGNITVAVEGQRNGGTLRMRSWRAFVQDLPAATP